MLCGGHHGVQGQGKEMRHDSGLDWAGNGGGEATSSASRCFLRVAPIGFTDRLEMGYEKEM